MIIKSSAEPMAITRGLVDVYVWCNMLIRVGETVCIWSNSDLLYHYKGEKAIVKKIYFKKFLEYTNCSLSLFIPSFNKTIWVQADDCDYGEGSWCKHGEYKLHQFS